MKIEVDHRPSYALAKVQLAPGEEVRGEAGAMVAMLGDVAIETKAAGGIGKALKRSLLGGESFFQNTFRAGQGGGEVHFAPPLPGDIVVREMRGNDALVVQDGAYLASGQGVDVDAKWGGAKMWGSGEGFFLLRVSGQGPLLLTSYGAIEGRSLQPGERFSVDTGHMVAYTDGMQVDVRRIGGIKTTLFSGEGLVTDFVGPGTVWTQSRSSQAFLAWLIPRMPGTGGKESGRGGLNFNLG